MNKVLKNFIYNGTYKLLVILIPIVLTPYLTRTLGSTKLGIDSYVTSIVTIVQLFGTLGINIYSSREIAKKRDDKTQLTNLYYELQTIRWTMALLVTTGYALFASMHEYRVYFLIQALTLVSYCIDVTWLFTGLEEMKLPVTRNIIIKITQTILIFCLVKDESDLVVYILIVAISNTISALCMYTQVGKKVGKYNRKELNIKQHIKPVVALFLPQVASTIYVQFDRTMIGLLSDDISFVSIYDKAENIIKIPLQFTAAATAAVLPRVAYEHSQGNRDGLKKLLETEMKYVMLFLIPCVAGMIVVADALCVTYLGNGYAASAAVMKVLAPVIFIIGLGEIFGVQLLVAVNEVKGLTISYGGGAIANLIFNSIFIPMWNAKGAAIGTLAAEGMVIIIQIIVARKYIGTMPIFSSSFKKIIAAGAMFTVLIFYGNPDKSVFRMCLQMIIGVVVYIISLFILRDKEFKNLVRTIRNRFRREPLESK